MTIGRVKLTLWLGALAGGALALVLLLQGIGVLIAVARDAGRVDAALGELEVWVDLGRIAWTDQDAGPRPLEPFVRDRIAEAYLRGFDELAYALRSGDGSGLVSYVVGPARDDALRVVGQVPHRFETDRHRLTLHFYAPDGASVAFRDRYRYREARLEPDGPVAVRVADRTVEVVMTLDDGLWRVRHLRVIADDPAPPVAPLPPTP